MAAEEKVQSLDAGDKAKSGRSTIEFPYLDQENSWEIAQAVHEIGGSGCEWDQLAAHLKQAAQGGGFRLRMISAKQFGLVTYDRGAIGLTALGLRAIDPQQSKVAKVDSFLQVPLYKALFDKFRGTTLPPTAGLEREMSNLGVTSKQADKARQAFARSAKFAGFFDFGADRLVSPAKGNGADKSQSQENDKQDTDKDSAGRNSGSSSGGDLHPFIRGLIDKLPKPESDWSLVDRAKWLTTAANIFDLMYKDDDLMGLSVDVSSNTLSIKKGRT